MGAVVAAALVIAGGGVGPAAREAVAMGRGSGELAGGTLGVGVETARAGSTAGTGGSPSSPALVRYVATPLPAGRTGDLENVCNASSTPGQVVWGWLYDVIAYTRDGRELSETHECVPFPDPNARGAPPPVPVLPRAPTVADVWHTVALPRPVVGVNPVSRGVTGLATRLWSGGARTAQVAATINGFRVTGSAFVVGYRFATDEGPLGASAAPGDESVPAAAHVFTRKGPHALSVSSVWHATVTMTGPAGTAAIPIDIDTAVLTVTAAYPVVEVRSRLVG